MDYELWAKVWSAKQVKQKHNLLAAWHEQYKGFTYLWSWIYICLFDLGFRIFGHFANLHGGFLSFPVRWSWIYIGLFDLEFSRVLKFLLKKNDYWKCYFKHEQAPLWLLRSMVLLLCVTYYGLQPLLLVRALMSQD